MSDDTAQPGPKRSANDLFLRVVSAAVLIPPVIGAIYMGTPYFEILIGLGGIILCWEWYTLCGLRIMWLITGAFYIGIPSFALVYLRNEQAMGFETVLWIFILVWAADTFAYATGRLCGGPKLAPSISPNKTWSGLLGGIFGAGTTGLITALVLGHNSVIPLLLISATLGALSQGGDLVESWIKRRFDKKDAGSIIPGHGGLFDRVDGLLVAAFATALLGIFTSKGSVLTWV